MLLSIRSKAGTWFVRILFGVLVLSFALWGVEDVVRRQHARPVVQVGDIKVSAQAYGQEFDRAVQQLRASFGPDFDATKARQFGVDRQVLSQIVSRSLFDTEIKALGLTVPDAQLADEIRGNALFQDSSGKFDRAKFDAILRENGLTEQSFTALLRGDVVRRQLVAAVAGGIAGPEPFARLLYIYRAEQRKVRAVVLPPDAVKDLPKPTEADLRAYYKAHADAFAEPEYRKISFFTVQAADLAANMQIPDADLRQAYEERKANYAQPEKRDFRQMLFQTEAQAKAAAEKLRGGATAGLLSKEAGLIASNEIKAAARDELLPDVAEAVFATPVDGVAGPVHSALGWTVAQVLKIIPAATTPFETARDELRRSLAAQRATDRLYAVANQIEDERAGGATMDEVAKKLGVAVRTVDAVDRSGKAPDGTKVAGLPDVPKVLEVAFESQVNEDLDPIELPTGGYALLRVAAIIPAKTPPYEQVAAAVQERQHTDARQAALEALGRKMVARARDGGDLAALAREAKQPVRDLGAIGRDYKGEVLPPELVRTLFSIKQDAVAGGVSDDSYVVAQVTGIVPADPAAHADEVKAIRSEIASAMSEDLLRQYQAALEKRFKVEVDMAAAEAAIGAAQD